MLAQIINYLTSGITFSDFKIYYKAIVPKQHGTGTKTDTLINGIESKTQK